MKNIIKPLLVVATAILFTQCGNEKFKIIKGKVGEVTIETKVRDLDKIFENDSIVKVLSEGVKGSNYFQDDDEYLIYEKGGKHLLTLVPKEQLDVLSTFKSVEIFDGRYKTETGITINSNFGEINVNSKISKELLVLLISESTLDKIIRIKY